MISPEKMRKVKSPDNEIIKMQIQEWESKFKENNSRGADMINFIACGKQWEPGVVDSRTRSNKESLTLNVCNKELKKMLSQNAEIEFSIDVHPSTKEAKENIQESNVFSLLMNNIALSENITRGLTDTFDKSASFGYAFGEVNFKRINNDELSLYPVYIPHRDPRLGFWDTNAFSPTKIDGKFCGIKRSLTEKELKSKGYSDKTLGKCNVQQKDNVVVDYWWREEVEADFYLLKGGSYKRKDLLTYDDKNNLMTKEMLSAIKMSDNMEMVYDLVMPGTMDIIYFKRICNFIDLDAHKEYPTFDLPLLYHGSFTIWTPDVTSYTIPFGYELKGAQKLLNFVNSQIATQAKNSSSDKWLFGPQHVETQQQMENAAEINKKEGGLSFGGDISQIRRERAAEVSMSLIQMSQSLKQIIDEINGAMIDPNNAQQTVISGEALDKITRNMRLMNDKALAKHIFFVNDVAMVIGQMIPKIITEERAIVIKKKDGSSDTIVVNESLGDGEIKNNIKDIRNKFNYNVKASQNETMQKENTVRYLIQSYQIQPTLLNDTADIYFRNLDCKDSAELSRRAIAKIDPDLIAFSQGEITEDEYRQLTIKKQQAASDRQKQAVLDSPDYQSAVATAAAEHRKADAYQKDADTKRIKTLGDIINKENSNDIELAKVLLDHEQGEAAHSIQVLEKSMDVNNQMIDRMREVIGDDDMPLQGQSQPVAANAEGGENPNPNTPGVNPNAGS